MFNVNTPFWRFLNKMTDQFLLSLLWLLCSIPVVTFGASTTAFVTISMELHQDLEGAMFRDFFRQFRRNFKRATVTWLVQIVALLFVAVDLRLCYLMDSGAGWFLIAVITVLAVLFFMAAWYTWPLIAHSSASLGQIWKQAAYIMVTYLPHSAAMLLLLGIGFIIADLAPYLGILIPSVICYQYARIFVWIFGRDPNVQTILEEGAQQGG